MPLLNKIVKKVDEITSSNSTRFVINLYIKEYGKLVELKIDNQNNKIAASILLNGDTVPIRLCVEKYQILNQENSATIEIIQASSDRPWINAIINNFVIGRKFNIPSGKVEFANDFLA